MVALMPLTHCFPSLPILALLIGDAVRGAPASSSPALHALLPRVITWHQLCNSSGYADQILQQDDQTCFAQWQTYKPWTDIPAPAVGGKDPDVITPDDTLNIPPCKNQADCTLPDEIDKRDIVKREEIGLARESFANSHPLLKRAACNERNLELPGKTSPTLLYETSNINPPPGFRDRFINQVSIWFLRAQRSATQFIIKKFQAPWAAYLKS